MLTQWLKTLYDDCNFKIRFSTLDKEYYRKEWEARNLSVTPIKPPEFFLKNVSLGDVESELKSMYVEAILDNAGYKQPHKYILASIRFANNRYFLSFVSEYSNWPVSRLVIFDEHNKIVRNDFKKVHTLSWQDFKEGEYQPKRR